MEIAALYRLIACCRKIDCARVAVPITPFPAIRDDAGGIGADHASKVERVRTGSSESRWVDAHAGKHDYGGTGAVERELGLV